MKIWIVFVIVYAYAYWIGLNVSILNTCLSFTSINSSNNVTMWLSDFLFHLYSIAIIDYHLRFIVAVVAFSHFWWMAIMWNIVKTPTRTMINDLRISLICNLILNSLLITVILMNTELINARIYSSFEMFIY